METDHLEYSHGAETDYSDTASPIFDRRRSKRKKDTAETNSLFAENTETLAKKPRIHSPIRATSSSDTLAIETEPADRAFNFSTLPPDPRATCLDSVEKIIHFEKYIRKSSFIYNPTLANWAAFEKFGLFLQPTPLLGSEALGVFFGKDIPAGTCIGQYTGKKYDRQAYEDTLPKDGKVGAYVFNLTDSRKKHSECIDAEFEGEWPRYINDSRNPNVYAKQANVNGEDGIFFYALHDIPAGSQIVFYYGKEYFPALEINPLFNNASRYAGEGSAIAGRVPFLYEKNILVLDEKDAFLVSNSEEMINRFHFLVPIMWDAVARDDISGIKAALEPYADYLKMALNVPAWQLDAQHHPLPDISQPCLTTLMFACYRGSENSILWLLENGADPDCFHHLTGYTALRMLLAGTASAETKIRAGSALLEKMHFPFAPDVNNRDILFYVIDGKQPELLEVLTKNLAVWQKYDLDLDPFACLFKQESASFLDEILYWPEKDFETACIAIHPIFAASTECLKDSCLWKQIAKNKCFSKHHFSEIPLKNLLLLARTLNHPECKTGLRLIQQAGRDLLAEIQLTIGLKTDRRFSRRNPAAFFANPAPVNPIVAESGPRHSEPASGQNSPTM